MKTTLIAGTSLNIEKSIRLYIINIILGQSAAKINSYERGKYKWDLNAAINLQKLGI